MQPTNIIIPNLVRSPMNKWLRLISNDSLFQPVVDDLDQFHENLHKGFMTHDDYMDLQETFNHCQDILQNSPFKSSFKFFRILAGFFNSQSQIIPPENQIQAEVTP